MVPDNPRGARRAMEHLGGLGHDTITYLAGPEASWADGMRWRSLLEESHELELRVKRLRPFLPRGRSPRGTGARRGADVGGTTTR